MPAPLSGGAGMPIGVNCITAGYFLILRFVVSIPSSLPRFPPKIFALTSSVMG